MDLSLDTTGERLSAPAPEAPPPPSTSHLDMADTGELIPNLPAAVAALDPDTSGITLDEAEFDLSDCAPPPPAAPQVDLSGLDVAPTGADVLEEKYRGGDEAAPPATDHITLSDPSP